MILWADGVAGDVAYAWNLPSPDPVQHSLSGELQPPRLRPSPYPRKLEWPSDMLLYYSRSSEGKLEHW